MRSHWILVALLAFFATFVATQPLYRDFEPTTEDKKQVLLEIFDALFVPTVKPTSSDSPWTIRGDIENHFGYISRTGVNYILASLGYIHDADLGAMEELMTGSHMPDTYQHFCRIPPGLRRALHNARNLNEWLLAIEVKTGKTLPITRAFLSNQ